MSPKRIIDGEGLWHPDTPACVTLPIVPQEPYPLLGFGARLTQVLPPARENRVPLSIGGR